MSGEVLHPHHLQKRYKVYPRPSAQIRDTAFAWFFTQICGMCAQFAAHFGFLSAPLRLRVEATCS
jgi:hypothetical protein